MKKKIVSYDIWETKNLLELIIKSILQFTAPKNSEQEMWKASITHRKPTKKLSVSFLQTYLHSFLVSHFQIATFQLAVYVCIYSKLPLRIIFRHITVELNLAAPLRTILSAIVPEF